jgi:hypothetical protein
MKPIHTRVKIAYLHTDISVYGWGGILNKYPEAQGFSSAADEQQHHIWKELKPVVTPSRVSYRIWPTATSSCTITTR